MNIGQERTEDGQEVAGPKCMRKVKGRTGQNVNMTGQRREERRETSAEKMK